jgi:hypothetical protein
VTSETTHPGSVVVLVLSHRDPPLVRRLVDRLRAGNDVFVGVHHDPSGPPLDLARGSNVALVPDPIHCKWGGYELVQATWHSLQWAARTVPNLSWVLFISGQDYPAMPVSRIEAELHTTPHDAFLRHFRIDGDPAADVHPWQQLCRTRYFHRRRLPGLPRSVPWPRRHPFHDGVHAYAGDMWFNISGRALHNMLESPFAPTLLQFLRAAPIPDEMFIASMVCNDASLDVVNDRRRYVRFERGARHPHSLTHDDVPEIVTSGAFFARKVSLETPEVLDRLDTVGLDLPGSPAPD